MEIWNRLTTAAIDSVIGGILSATGKKVWDKYINNPDSNLYYKTLLKNAKRYGMMILVIVGIKFYTLMLKFNIGRKVSKEGQEKIVIGVVFLLLVSFAAIYLHTWKRKQNDAEPVLF